MDELQKLAESLNAWGKTPEGKLHKLQTQCLLAKQEDLNAKAIDAFWSMALHFYEKDKKKTH